MENTLNPKQTQAMNTLQQRKAAGTIRPQGMQRLQMLRQGQAPKEIAMQPAITAFGAQQQPSAPTAMDPRYAGAFNQVAPQAPNDMMRRGAQAPKPGMQPQQNFANSPFLPMLRGGR